MARARVGRDEWRKRVERWKESGLTAKEFAARAGINAGTLQFWRYKLGRDDRSMVPRRSRSAAGAILSSLVEVRPPPAAFIDQRYEIELGNGRRLRFAGGFDRESVWVLVGVLETT